MIIILLLSLDVNVSFFSQLQPSQLYTFMTMYELERFSLCFISPYPDAYWNFASLEITTPR